MNLKLDEKARDPVLTPDDLTTPSYLIVHFTPQNIAEEAFYDASNEDQRQIGTPLPSVPDTGPSVPSTGSAGKVVALRSGPTRLVFLVPNNIQIPFTIAGLLHWSKLELHVSPIADIVKVALIHL
jgi:hypothetical protein